MSSSSSDTTYLQAALELAKRGEGHVEPNPMVGAIVVAEGEIVGEGWHQQFGGPHAEVHALAAAGERARGATLYITLEPCCHTGKTPPCTEAVIAAGIARVVAAVADPFPKVQGGGFDQLRAAGIECEVGMMEQEARELLAPYLKLTTTGVPWVIAKWAMTLDGKIATHTGSSQWITNEVSRSRVHELRGRVDAIVVGSRTANVDNPMLTARPSGPRVATRIVLGGLDGGSQLASTIDQAPLMVVQSREPNPGEYDWLTTHGGELLHIRHGDHMAQINELLAELGRRRMTNVLFEGGGQVLGALFDARAVDEVHAFIAPKLVGGSGARSPIEGLGISDMGAALQLEDVVIEQTAGDLYVRGRVPKVSAS